MTISRPTKTAAAAVLLLCTLSNAVATSNGRFHKEGIVSLPIRPHHVELERRKRQRSLQEGSTEDNLENDLDSIDSKLFREQYRRRDEAMQVGALFEGYGTHYVDLWCGSPPQRQTVIVDTGSGITAFPCSQCNDCGAPDYHIDHLFEESESSTFSKSVCSTKQDCIMSRSSCTSEACHLSMSYAEGSRWSAYEAVDRCYVAGYHETPMVASKSSSMNGDDMDPSHAVDLAFDMTFGCQTIATNLFKTQLADGIMGMSNQRSTFWAQMFDAGKMGSDQQFSLCYSRPPDVLREGTEAGMMTLGGADDRIHKTPMVYTPGSNSGRSSFFSVKIRRFMLRDGKYGTSAKSTSDNPNEGVTILDINQNVLNKGGTIVDSGTTDTYFFSGIATQFKTAFKTITGREHTNKPMKITEEQMLAFPTILIQLESDDSTNSHIDDMFHTPGLAGALDSQHKSDVILAIPPSHYMEYNKGSKTYTSRFYPTERSGNVLGANAMMGHDVFFDTVAMTIGWAESDCDYTNQMKNLGYDWEITGELKSVQEGAAGGGKHHTNNNQSKTKKDDTDDSECESISSGAHCEQVEGCTWGWGKCTQIEEHENPIIANPNDEALPIFELIHAHPVEVGAFLAIALLSCCCYCLFCRKPSGIKYSRTAMAESIEMTDGGEDAFQDEPDDGTGSGSGFRDEPEPEFEGDFA